MKKRAVFSMAVLYFLLSGFTWGGGDYRTPYDMRLEDVRGGQSYARVEFESMTYMPGNLSMGINFYGLEPNTLYTVWYANEKGERAPAGVSGNVFRTDGGGKGRYVTSVDAYYLDDWDNIEVYAHPDGNPSNTMGMVAVLKGELLG
ncbi:MAG TPA: hypothetical protein VII64_04355 [Thermodesulfobacteriota bacterium]